MNVWVQAIIVLMLVVAVGTLAYLKGYNQALLDIKKLKKD